MRGLTATEYHLLDFNDHLPDCDCLPDGSPGEIISHPKVAETLVSQGRAQWVVCRFEQEHFCVTASGREAMRIYRSILVCI